MQLDRCDHQIRRDRAVCSNMFHFSLTTFQLLIAFCYAIEDFEDVGSLYFNQQKTDANAARNYVLPVRRLPFGTKLLGETLRRRPNGYMSSLLQPRETALNFPPDEESSSRFGVDWQSRDGNSGPTLTMGTIESLVDTLSSVSGGDVTVFPRATGSSGTQLAQTPVKLPSEMRCENSVTTAFADPQIQSARYHDTTSDTAGGDSEQVFAPVGRQSAARVDRKRSSAVSWKLATIIRMCKNNPAECSLGRGGHNVDSRGLSAAARPPTKRTDRSSINSHNVDAGSSIAARAKFVELILGQISRPETQRLSPH